jgi:alpha-galactosidase
MLEEEYGIPGAKREDIKVNVVGVNHFTWLTNARYRNIDLFPIYKEFCDKYAESGYTKGHDDNWLNSVFGCIHKVKFDLFRRYGYIAAAGDRHLAEFCEGKWYLKDPETVKKWGFDLTSVDFRREQLKERLQKSEDYRTGKLPVELEETGEDGVKQIRALLGLEDLVTNVNIPNKGQIPNLPMGAIVETNAVFRDDSLVPVEAGELPVALYGLISRIVAAQQMVVEAVANRDLELAFKAFVNDPLVTIDHETARVLFDEMVENTKAYLTEYFK